MLPRAMCCIAAGLLSLIPQYTSAQPGYSDSTWTAGACGSPSFSSDSMIGIFVADGGNSYLVGSSFASGDYVVGCNANGGLDATFAGGRVPITPPPPFSFSARGAVIAADGRLVVIGAATRSDTGATGIGAIRINLDGMMDASYGLYQGRFIPYPVTPRITAALRETDGKIAIGGDDGRPDHKPVVARFAADGSEDTSFDQGGINTQFPTIGSVGGLARQPDGKLLVAGWGWFPLGTSTLSRATLTRLNADGAVDTAFGTGGTALLDAWPFGNGTLGQSVAALPDGRAVTAGVYTQAGNSVQGVVLARFNAAGGIDPTFAQGGFTTTTVPGATRTQVLVQADGKLLVPLSADATASQVLRYSAEGMLDLGFGLGGRVAFPSAEPIYADLQDIDKVLVLVRIHSYGYRPHRLLLDGPSTFTSLRSSLAIAPAGVTVSLTAQVTPPGPDGRFVRFAADNRELACGGVQVVSGFATCSYTPVSPGQHTLRATYTGDSAGGVQISASPDLVQVTTSAGTQAAVEFYHGRYNHYFLTANPEEVATLDAGVINGWRRTGIVFPAWPLGTPGRSDVCRFWTGAAFAPVSSHFYTPYPAECASVRANHDWMYEGTVFALGATQSAGTCAADTTPLYRYYNNGQGGAPNHRFFTSEDLRPDMSARGWVAEGNGERVVFACVPAN